MAYVQTGRAINHRSDSSSDQEVPYVTVANVKDGYLDLAAVKKMRLSTSEIDRYRLRVGDVLFTEGGDADKLGRGTVWRGDIEPCLHQNHVFAVRTDQHRLLPQFLAAYAASNPGKRYFLGAAKQTTNLASINSTQLLQMPLPLPAIAEQLKFIDLSETTAEVSRSLQRELLNLRQVKAVAASALLTGSLRVKPVEAT